MFLFVLIFLQQTNANITCYGCEYINWRYESALWPCDNSTGPWKLLFNCTSCIKQTEVQQSDFMKPRWGQESTTLTTTSRYCVVDFPPKFPDQCIFFYGSSSVIEQCFCSTSFCNAGSFLLNSYSLILCLFAAISYLNHCT